MIWWLEHRDLVIGATSILCPDHGQLNLMWENEKLKHASVSYNQCPHFRINIKLMWNWPLNTYIKALVMNGSAKQLTWKNLSSFFCALGFLILYKDNTFTWWFLWGSVLRKVRVRTKEYKCVSVSVALSFIFYKFLLEGLAHWKSCINSFIIVAGLWRSYSYI